jgi:hypothetical protein
VIVPALLVAVHDWSDGCAPFFEEVARLWALQVAFAITVATLLMAGFNFHHKLSKVILRHFVHGYWSFHRAGLILCQARLSTGLEFIPLGTLQDILARFTQLLVARCTTQHALVDVCWHELCTSGASLER